MFLFLSFLLHGTQRSIEYVIFNWPVSIQEAIKAVQLLKLMDYVLNL